MTANMDPKEITKKFKIPKITRVEIRYTQDDLISKGLNIEDFVDKGGLYSRKKLEHVDNSGKEEEIKRPIEVDSESDEEDHDLNRKFSEVAEILGEQSDKEVGLPANAKSQEPIKEKSSTEIKQELSSAIETDWVPRQEDDSDIIHIPMDKNDLLDYEYHEVEEVVNQPAILGLVDRAQTPFYFPALKLMYTHHVNTSLTPKHPHTHTYSIFNLKCSYYFTGKQVRGT